MKITTSRFGELEIPGEKVITFPWGLPGFEGLRGFVLLPVEDTPPFSWLQSVEDSHTAFLLVDPFLFFKDYEISLTDQLRKELLVEDKSHAFVQVIATIPGENIQDMTVNLVGPVVINPKRNLGKQIILENTCYGTRHPIFEEAGKKGHASKSR
ncbi:MAG: flagellar assembly protein FliW [Clostridia bacterium]|nr:flagellar assembly protein FliW [Clostridia bacterium]